MRRLRRRAASACSPATPSVNPDAPIICCTAEILANLALREGADADVGQVVMDEFHYYADPDRGWAWQVPLLELPRAQFLLMSATLGDVTRVRGRPHPAHRPADARSSPAPSGPVPLHFSYATTPVHETIEELLQHRPGADLRRPLHPGRRAGAGAGAHEHQRREPGRAATRSRRRSAAFRFSAGFGRTLSRLVRHGIGVHHAGMLPRYRRLVEQLAQAGLLKVICGTDTLGVGINVPDPHRAPHRADASTTARGSGTSRPASSTRSPAARAGPASTPPAPSSSRRPSTRSRTSGCWPRRATTRRSAARSCARSRPRGSSPGAEPTFERLVGGRARAADLELRGAATRWCSTWSPAPATRSRPCGTCSRTTTRTAAAQRRHIRQAIAIYRALLAAGVVERLPEPDATGRPVRLTVDLQPDFALNQPLSPFALAAMELLDRESPTYALDVLSVVESTLDDPRQVLSAQQFKARGEAVAQMKRDGIEYEERMELLEEVTHPKPLAELLERGLRDRTGTGHPWVADHELRPKSVARDMFERAMSFAEYVGSTGSPAARAWCCATSPTPTGRCARPCPSEARTEERRGPHRVAGRARPAGRLEPARGVGVAAGGREDLGPDAGPRGAGRRGRPAAGHGEPRAPSGCSCATRCSAASSSPRCEHYDELGELDAEAGWTADRWEQAHDAVLRGARRPRHGRRTRAARRTSLLDEHPEGCRAGARLWRVRQIFDDPDGDHDWGITAEVDLAASDEAGEAVVRVSDVGRPGPSDPG